MSKPRVKKVGRNPLQKLNRRQSSDHLQSEALSNNQGRLQIFKKVKELDVRFDWRQFYDQALPERIKHITQRLLLIKTR